MPVFTEAGRGRKQCPKCKNYVGIRSAKCEGCDTPFTKTEKTPSASPDASTTPEPIRHHKSHQRRVSVPAGHPPVNLKGTDETTVLKWANDTRAHYEQQDETLEVSGLIYLIRYFYDIGSREHKTVREHLEVNLITSKDEEFAEV